MQAWAEEDAFGKPGGNPVARRLAGQFEHLETSAFQPPQVQAVALQARAFATPAARQPPVEPMAPQKPFRSMARDASDVARALRFT